MPSKIYPKAQAPLTWPVLDAANARAERWRRRTLQARAQRDELEKQIKEIQKAIGI